MVEACTCRTERRRAVSVSAFGVDHGEISKFDPLKWGAVRSGMKSMKSLKNTRATAMGRAEGNSLLARNSVRSAQADLSTKATRARVPYQLNLAENASDNAYVNLRDANILSERVKSTSKQLGSDIGQAVGRTSLAGAAVGGAGYGAHKWRKKRKANND